MILRSFTPTWHPPIAQNYFELYNDLNHTNNILYYDTTSSFINFPKVFTYNRINSSYGFQLYKVTTNTSSDNPTFNPSLPATQGTFTINKMVADSGNTSPSIDLYFKGIIQYDMSYDCDYPEGVGYNTYSASISPNTFPSDSTITVTYGYYDRFVLPTYSYSGDRVVISCNWSTTKRTVYQASGSASLPAPTEALTINKGIVPTVYIDNWISTDHNPEPQKLYARVNGGGASGFSSLPPSGSGEYWVPGGTTIEVDGSNYTSNYGGMYCFTWEASWGEEVSAWVYSSNVTTYYA